MLELLLKKCRFCGSFVDVLTHERIFVAGTKWPLKLFCVPFISPRILRFYDTKMCDAEVATHLFYLFIYFTSEWVDVLRSISGVLKHSHNPSVSPLARPGPARCACCVLPLWLRREWNGEAVQFRGVLWRQSCAEVRIALGDSRGGVWKERAPLRRGNWEEKLWLYGLWLNALYLGF